MFDGLKEAENTRRNARCRCDATQAGQERQSQTAKEPKENQILTESIVLMRDAQETNGRFRCDAWAMLRDFQLWDVRTSNVLRYGERNCCCKELLPIGV